MTSEKSELELKVTFFPPLYLQRRIWILDAIRRHQVQSVLDVGCGEGELLTALRQPAAWLAPVDLHQGEGGTDEIANIHVTRLAGLDVSDDVQFASQLTSPPSPGSVHEIRWEPLLVQIWKGGLEYFNPVFTNYECIVASEVIEHLPQNVLSHFAPIILGAYHPRILLLTTPSYTFNARFTAPDAPASARSGYPDPTGRTSRIFRHEDHKFEWTVEEFKQWCNEAAEQWGYVVEVSSVGMAVETDRWGRDAKLGGASQVAEFRRLDDSGSVANRTERSKSMLGSGSEHELYATHTHLAHPRSQQPVSLQEIGESVKSYLETSRESFTRIEALWFEKEIAILCGGWIELLVKAIADHPKLVLHKHGTEKRANWQVELIGSAQERQNLWLEEDGNSMDYIPHDYFPDEPYDTDRDQGGTEENVIAGSSDYEVEWGVSEDSDSGWFTEEVEAEGFKWED